MSDWHVAASLQALLAEINQRWPGRDKRSDGALGDAAHSARVSDHNPDYSAPGARRGVVRARDIDKDGIDLQELLDELRRECRDASPRVAYVIYNRRIMRSYPKTIGGRTYQPGEWAPYDGPNPHTGHVHVSINHTAAAEVDTSPWFTPKEDDDMPLTPADAELIVDRLLNRKIGESTVADCLARSRALALRLGEKGDLNLQLDRIETEAKE